MFFFHFYFSAHMKIDQIAPIIFHPYFFIYSIHNNNTNAYKYMSTIFILLRIVLNIQINTDIL
jgi:hypothetical protein